MTPATGATGKERPILFSSSMALAVHAGRKRMTRRIIKPQPIMTTLTDRLHLWASEDSEICCPYGEAGDRLWVRETWAPQRHGSYEPIPRDDKWTNLKDRWSCCVAYKAEYPLGHDDLDGHWRPSIFMFRWMSRTLLNVAEVRAERLNDISEVDAVDEGVSMDEDGWFFVRGLTLNGRLLKFRTARECFKALWESINGQGSWDRNDWVWAISFRKIGGAHAE